LCHPLVRAVHEGQRSAETIEESASQGHGMLIKETSLRYDESCDLVASYDVKAHISESLDLDIRCDVGTAQTLGFNDASF